jgi:hypothetical protein
MEKNRIESPIPIVNEDLVNKSCSLLTLAENEVSILSGKGTGARVYFVMVALFWLREVGGNGGSAMDDRTDALCGLLLMVEDSR